MPKSIDNWEGTGKIKNKRTMYKKPIFRETDIIRNESYVGETIEQKIERVMNNQEPIEDGAPLIYQERNEGVAPAYDIRTDKHDIVIETQAQMAHQRDKNRKEAFEELTKKKTAKESKQGEEDTEGESTQGTSAGGSQTSEK